MVEKSQPKTDVHKELTRFSNFLKKEGYKITNQRLLVAEKIFNTNQHFTVDSLTDGLKNHKNEISRATIYRIVSLMVDSGQLIEHHFGQNVKYYEHIPETEHHDHLVCMDCGRIDEFINPRIEELQTEIANEHGFTLADHSLNLYGRCQQLAKDGSCDRRKEEGQDGLDLSR